MKHRYLPALYAAASFSLLLGAGCSNDEPDGPQPEPGVKKKTILLYAVASNNLYSNLINDKQEIIKGVMENNIDLSRNSIMVYEVVPNSMEYGETPRLLELLPSGNGEYEYVEVKQYDRSLYSTDPERISEVIDDVRVHHPSNTYGLVLWSHALGWSPFFSDRDLHPATKANPVVPVSDNSSITVSKADLPLQYSFGSDTNSDTGYTDKIDIDELADAIPDGMFEFIWIDACMMSGIETVYELRNKCDYFGGYPTEVYSPGMPYNLTIPYLMKEKADLVGCGKAFFDYYANNTSPYLRTATVAVIDMSVLDEMASFCKTNYAETGVPSTSGMDYYSGSQRVAYRFYDFGQYTLAKIALGNRPEAEQEFRQLLDKLVIYRDATEREFTGRELNLEEYSGLSSHVYDPVQTGSAAEYYRTLDWYKAVY